jgi:hypothetical protein
MRGRIVPCGAGAPTARVSGQVGLGLRRVILSHSAVRLGRRAIAVAVVAFALGAPAAAHAVVDLGISQVASAARVPEGQTVTYTATVTNHGTESVPNAYPSLFSLKPGKAPAADNPYQSAVPSQGVCSIWQPVGVHNVVCDVGPLAPGESAEVVAVARINEAADHFAVLDKCESIVPPSCLGFWTDADASNDRTDLTTTIASGSKKISIKGLPAGCAADDFTVKAKAKGKDVEQITAQLRGQGVHETLGKSDGNRLTATVEVAALESGEVYDLTVTAKPQGGKTLKATAGFERC